MKKIVNKFYKSKYNKLYVLITFLVIGTGLYSPFIHNHFTYDDFLFVSFLEEKVPVNPLTGFWAVDYKYVKVFQSMWWLDQEAKGYFFRPVPSVVIKTAYNIWGRDSALWLHLLSVLLHGVNAFLVFVLLNRLSKNYSVSLLAGFLYLIFVHHIINIGWIATNTDLLAVFFMVSCMIFYLKFRQEGRLLFFAISTVMLLLAFGCKETASITPAAIMLYEFIYIGKKGKDKISIANRLGLFFKKWKYWIVSLILLAGFLIYYKSAGFGVNSLMYHDPFFKPAAFLKNLVIGYPMMFLAITSVAPISFPVFMPSLFPAFWIAGCFSMVLFLIVLKPYLKDNNVIYSLLLFIISILPQLSVDATERQMYFPAVAGCFLISYLILQIPFLKRITNSEYPKPVKYIGMVSSYYLLISSVLISIVLLMVEPSSYSSSAQKPEKYTLQAKEIADKYNADKIFLINTPGSLNQLYYNDIYRFHANKYIDFYVLFSGDGKVWLKKENDSTITVKTDKKGWLTNMIAMLARNDPVLNEGKIYNNPDFRVTIKKVTPEKDDLLEAEFLFNRIFKPGGSILLYFDGETIKQFDMNSAIPGEWIFIGDTSDVLKIML
jgi:hypothetical protein